MSAASGEQLAIAPRVYRRRPVMAVAMRFTSVSADAVAAWLTSRGISGVEVVRQARTVSLRYGGPRSSIRVPHGNWLVVSEQRITHMTHADFCQMYEP
jgi:hypothetical protein